MAGDDRLWFHEFNLTDQTKKQGKAFMFDIQLEKFQKLNSSPIGSICGTRY